MIRKGLVVFAVAAAVWSQAAADQGDLPPEALDGMYITLAEVRANSAQMFAAFAGPSGGPIPKDRFVSKTLPAEVMPSSPDRKLLAQLFTTLDVNGDGQLTREEWNNRLERDLQVADQNGDGRVTVKELANARENMSFGDALGMLF